MNRQRGILARVVNVGSRLDRNIAKTRSGALARGLLWVRPHMKNFALVPLLACVSLVVGCDGGEPSDPHDQLGLVKEAIEAPTGNVDATSMKTIAADFEALSRANAAISAYNYAGGASAECTSGSDVDMACATQGELTGSISYTIEALAVSASSASATVIVDYDNVCAGEVCVTGSAIVEANTSEASTTTSLALSVDLTEGGATSHLFLGEDASVDQDGASVKVVVFDEEIASYVLEAETSAEGSSVSVVGANGSFQCSVSSAGGSCSGDASFSY